MKDRKVTAESAKAWSELIDLDDRINSIKADHDAEEANAEFAGVPIPEMSPEDKAELAKLEARRPELVKLAGL